MPLDMSFVQQYVNEQQQRAASSPGKRDINNYGYRNGQNRGRFLPPWPGSTQLAMHVWHHFQCPPGKSHFFCWENIYPGTGFQCPLCATTRKLRQMGLEPWRQEAADIPQTNWIDRMPIDQFGQAVPIERHPGPQIIDLNIKVFNYFMGVVASTMCDLTSLELGYDVLINYDGSKNQQKDPAVLPGNPMPLHQNPEIAKQWVSQCYDIKALKKMPNWQDQKGQEQWQKMLASSRELERMYLQTQGAVQGYGPGQVQQPMPGFSQPSAPAPMAPPPQMPQAPPPPMPQAPQFQQPMPQAPQFQQPQVQQPQFQQPMAPPPMPAPPPMAAPHMMGSPGSEPFGQQPTPTPPAPMPPPPPAPMPPPPPPPMPAAATAPAPDNRPPWEASAPPVPAPVPAPMPMAPPAPAQSAPTMMATSADGKPPCFGQSRLNLGVEWGASGQAPIKGGWSELPQEVGYRCLMCPHQLECKDKAVKTYPADYEKNGEAYAKPKA